MNRDENFMDDEISGTDESDIIINDPDLDLDDVIILDDDDLSDISSVKKGRKTKSRDVDDDIEDIEEDYAYFTEDGIKDSRDHTLKHDSIFKGAKETLDPEEQEQEIVDDRRSVIMCESGDDEEYMHKKRLTEAVYRVLSTRTDMVFTTDITQLKPRRKPSKECFNQYYEILVNELRAEKFTYCELLTELSVYFSEKLDSMLKSLNAEWRNYIFAELETHQGKSRNKTEITNRNLVEGTEIEFIDKEPHTNREMQITGIITSCDYAEQTFVVNSFERIWTIHISQITQIILNDKIDRKINALKSLDIGI